jgi:transposase
MLGALLMRHLTGILNYCHEKVPFGKVEAINGNIRAMLRRVTATGITRTSSSKSRRRPRPAVSVKPHEHGLRYRFW